jgi:hypothetical protein
MLRVFAGYCHVRRVKSGRHIVLASVNLCPQISRHTIFARVKILFLRKPRFEITFGDHGLSCYCIFLGKSFSVRFSLLFRQGRKQRVLNFCYQLICQSVEHRLSFTESAFPKVLSTLRFPLAQKHVPSKRVSFPSTTSPLSFVANFAATSACMF